MGGVDSTYSGAATEFARSSRVFKYGESPSAHGSSKGVRRCPDWLAPSTPQHKQRAACVCATAEPDPAPAHCVSWKEISASVPAASKDAGRSA
jgi:hypothetical protein